MPNFFHKKSEILNLLKLKFTTEFYTPNILHKI